jgi:hypothetical protein
MFLSCITFINLVNPLEGRGIKKGENTRFNVRTTPGNKELRERKSRCQEQEKTLWEKGRIDTTFSF